MKAKFFGIFFAAALIAASAPAVADPYIFGFTGGGAAQQLILGLSDQSSVTFDTGQNRFTSGILNQGWWSATDTNSDINDNIFVGTNVSHELNNFFTFFLRDITPGTVVSATLRVNDVGSGAGPFPVTYSLFDVSTQAATLNANVGTSAAIFNDLGSGALYASALLNANPAAPFDVVLGASAIADINGAAGGYFSIGGTLTPSASIPEPGTLALLGLGLAGLAASRRRKQ
jgi:hypothetical protein